MPSSPSYQHKNKDESFISTAVVAGLITAAVFGYLINGYFEDQNARAINQIKSATYQQYLRNTASEATVSLSQPLTEQLTVREQLLAHPAVTPGPGFAAPGVQSTGKVIVDALDQAQGRSSPHSSN